MNFKIKFDEKVKEVNDYLEKIMEIKDAPKTIVEAMKYSLFAGGKRIRPVISIAICEALGGKVSDVLPYAASIEMIHTYSLIHDDLPCMDDDDFRRGVPTNHKKYGEGIAVLAGDALLNFAFETMLKDLNETKNIKGIEASALIAKASGINGMIGGQVLDIEGTGKLMGEKELYEIHSLKTGAIIEAASSIGAIFSNNEEGLNLAKEYGKSLGIAFQIVDDVLDVTGDLKSLGKTAGKDEKENKTTFVTIYGLERAKELAKEYTTRAMEIANKIDSSNFLKELTLYLLERNN